MADPTPTTPREWELFYSVISVLCCITTGIICLNLKDQPPFVKNSPTEYGTVMFSILSAGVVGTLAGYVATLLQIFNLKKPPTYWVKIALFLIFFAAVCVGISIKVTFDKTSFNTRFEWDDLLTIGFALASAISVFIVYQHSDDSRWKFQFWIIELPLLISLVFIILGKFVVFNQTSPQFNEYVTGLLYYPKGTPYGYEEIPRHIRNDFRAAFWTGTMAGLVGVQLIIAQVAGLGLEMSLRNKRPKTP